MTFAATPDLIALMNRLADASGEVIRKYFRKNFSVEGKSDQSPVTIADREVEQTLRAMIQETRPDDGIWGEEFGAERMDAEFVWVLDPIDGTRSFSTGKPIFGTLIGLLHKGIPVLGVIDQPILRERWLGGVGYPTRFNGQPCTTRACASAESIIATLLPHFPQDASTERMRPFHAVDRVVATTATGGDCYAYALVASGWSDLVVETGIKLHDFAAIVPIIEAAGGRMTDWQGRRLDRHSAGDVVAVGDPARLPEIVAILQASLQTGAAA